MTCSVELRAAKIPFPVGILADHYWFVIKVNEQYERWEIWQHANVAGTCWGHLHQNLKAYDSGVGAGPSRVHYSWCGEKAERLASIIRTSPMAYKFCHLYRYWPGPNSNSYVQWILEQFQSDVQLGATAIGKDYVSGIEYHRTNKEFRLFTSVIGVRLLRRKRFEIQVLGLVIGFSLDPFRLILPSLREYSNNGNDGVQKGE